MARYNIGSFELSPADLVDAVAEGMDGLSSPGSAAMPTLLEGEVTFQLVVGDEYAELVEEAARRQGVRLHRVDDDELEIREDVEFAGADTEVPGDDEEDGEDE